VILVITEIIMGLILLACVGTREILSNIDPLSVPFLSNLNDA
jgi:hypothetical protein